MSTLPHNYIVESDQAGKRLDQFLTAQMPDLSRVRVQQLIAEEKVLVNGRAARPSLKLKGGESIEVRGAVQLPPLRAIAEDIPLDIVYEDEDISVINKAAGMMVHAGAGATDDARNRGTLVNALLHRYGELSAVGGETRPGIVHRLDRGTSGLMIVARNDRAHRKLARMFARREVHKTYLALVHGWPPERGTINTPIARDPVHRTRMRVVSGERYYQFEDERPKAPAAREAVTHYRVVRKLDTIYGKFALVEVRIETGRTHQIRVHLASLHHPIVGDTAYGAPHELRAPVPDRRAAAVQPFLAAPARNFLHSAAIELIHPRTGAPLSFTRPLPPELERFLRQLDTYEGAGRNNR